MRTGRKQTIISITIMVLIIGIAFLAPKLAAQSDKYPKMAPLDQYLMDRNAEILLARGAAPESISSGATVLTLGRQGYETAVHGKTVLSVWWKEAGWRSLTRLSSGTRR